MTCLTTICATRSATVGTPKILCPPDFLGLCAGIWQLLRLMGVFEGGNFQYARQDERERMDKDSGMAGVPGLSQRDQRSSQDSATVGASQAREPQTGVFRLWSEDQRNC